MGVVVSFFDGMSCGQIALNKAHLPYTKYFAAEIKPHGISVTKENFPETIHIGDVRKVSFRDGVLYTENGNYNVGKIDLFIGGSPCQDFSRGNSTRDGLQGEKSGLFFEYLRFKKEANPKYWLLENVIMSDADYTIISDYMETEPVRINSSRISAQLRDRLYWTNIGPEHIDLFGGRKCMIPQPRDLKIHLKDILEYGFTDRDKSRALLESDSRPLRTPLKMFHRYHSTGFTTVVFKDEETYNEMKLKYDEAMSDKQNANKLNVFSDKENIRYLTQTELERLQTVPEGYTKTLKRDDAACLLGDGWTVDVIAHIFKYISQF